MNKHLLGAAALAALLVSAAPASATVIFSDNFNDNNASDWSITPGSKGSTVITAAAGYLETYFNAPASTGAGYAGANHGFTLAGNATNVTLSLDGLTALCSGCTMRYQALVDGVLVLDGTDLRWTSRSVSVADLAAGNHILTLRHSTNAASSGHFTASFDNVVLSGDVVVAVPEPASWALMIGGLGLVGGALRRKARPTAFA